jgi:hypothetical protein
MPKRPNDSTIVESTTSKELKLVQDLHCDLCKKDFKSMQSFNDHQKTQTHLRKFNVRYGTNDKCITCEFCNTPHYQEKDYQRHLKTKAHLKNEKEHREDPKLASLRHEYNKIATITCKYCSSTIKCNFNNRRNHMHTKTHQTFAKERLQTLVFDCYDLTNQSDRSRLNLKLDQISLKLFYLDISNIILDYLNDDIIYDEDSYFDVHLPWFELILTQKPSLITYTLSNHAIPRNWFLQFMNNLPKPLSLSDFQKYKRDAKLFEICPRLIPYEAFEHSPRFGFESPNLKKVKAVYDNAFDLSEEAISKADKLFHQIKDIEKVKKYNTTQEQSNQNSERHQVNMQQNISKDENDEGDISEDEDDEGDMSEDENDEGNISKKNQEDYEIATSIQENHVSIQQQNHIFIPQQNHFAVPPQNQAEIIYPHERYLKENVWNLETKLHLRQLCDRIEWIELLKNCSVPLEFLLKHENFILMLCERREEVAIALLQCTVIVKHFVTLSLRTKLQKILTF